MFTYIEFRESSSSKMPFLKGTRIGVGAIWAHVKELDIATVACDYEVSQEAVMEAYAWADGFFAAGGTNE